MNIQQSRVKLPEYIYILSFNLLHVNQGPFLLIRRPSNLIKQNTPVSKRDRLANVFLSRLFTVTDSAEVRVRAFKRPNTLDGRRWKANDSEAPPPVPLIWNQNRPSALNSEDWRYLLCVENKTHSIRVSVYLRLKQSRSLGQERSYNVSRNVIVRGDLNNGFSSTC